MTVDFAWGRSPRLRVAAIRWKGPWSERKVRSQFERVERWAKQQKVRTGRWVFREFDERTFEAAIELKGSARASRPVRLHTFPAATVARVVFNPEEVSPRVIYHGLFGWLRAQRREGGVRSILSSREVYSGNPWRDARAWSQTEVQVAVRR